MEILKYILVFGIFPAIGAGIIYAFSTWSVNKLLADAEKLRQKRLQERLGQQGPDNQQSQE